MFDDADQVVCMADVINKDAAVSVEGRVAVGQHSRAFSRKRIEGVRIGGSNTLTRG